MLLYEFAAMIKGDLSPTGWILMIGWIGVVSHHLQSLLTIIEFNFCVCICMQSMIF